jgi:hypothetical protein
MRFGRGSARVVAPTILCSETREGVSAPPDPSPCFPFVLHFPLVLQMMYASTKDFFKGFLDGVGAELQATELCDIDEHEMHDRVGASITRK